MPRPPLSPAARHSSFSSIHGQGVVGVHWDSEEPRSVTGSPKDLATPRWSPLVHGGPLPRFSGPPDKGKDLMWTSELMALSETVLSLRRPSRT